MNKNNINIRLEKFDDFSTVENLVRESFWNVYRPGCVEHYLLHCLRGCKDFVHLLDFVIEYNGKIIGQIAYVNAQIKCDNGRIVPVMTAGPLCIHPDFQNHGFGKLLLDYSLNEAKKIGCNAVLIEGNYGFYSKCGFAYASEYNIRYNGLEVGDDSSFFLCNLLVPNALAGVTGVYLTPKCYFIDENKADEFDKQFPYKEKLILPTQIF